LIAFWISKYVWGSAMVSPIPIECPEKKHNKSALKTYDERNSSRGIRGNYKRWGSANPGFQYFGAQHTLYQIYLVFHSLYITLFLILSINPLRSCQRKHIYMYIEKGGVITELSKLLFCGTLTRN
jgi:hypothetical protein